jgi:hypothetical protein
MAMVMTVVQLHRRDKDDNDNDSGAMTTVSRMIIILAIATAMEVDKKATTGLSAASSARTSITKVLATMTAWREGRAIGLANAAFPYCCSMAIVLH